MSNVWVFVHDQLVMIISVPSDRKINRGRRLIKNASLIAVFTCSRAHLGAFGLGERVDRRGYSRSAKIMSKLEVIVISVGGCIAATWICTKSFWFLRPTDELLSFRSGARELRDPTEGTRISSLCFWQDSLGGQGGLNPCF